MADKGRVQIVDISSGPFDKETCTKPKTAFLKSLADHGIKTIVRYYSDKNNTPCKNITKEERAILHDHGFSIAIIYQYKGRTPGRYKKETGQADAELCIMKANALKQPDGSTIYFGIDGDVGTHDPEGVTDYLDQIGKVFKGRFNIGCYGPGAICSAALTKGLVTHTWVPEAPSWVGTQDFINSMSWTFYQNKTDMVKSGLAKGFGIEVDTDIVNPRTDTIGAFAKDGSIVKYDRVELKVIAEGRKWVKPLMMPLFDKPHGQSKGHMCIARILRVLERLEEGWVSVDIDEDGAADGCCEEKDLLPLDKMPFWVSGCTPMKL